MFQIEKGQTLMELVIVISVVLIIIGALTFSTIASIRNASFAQNQLQATKLAQEGLERVRTGRDRNRPISIIGITTVNSWSGTGTIWNYHISGDCDRPDLIPPGVCYFNVDSTGQLTNIGFNYQSTQSSPFPSLIEEIPTDRPVFRRAVLLSDDLNHDNNFNNDPNYQNQKEVTAIVKWTDFSGPHQSRLTTILRRL